MIKTIKPKVLLTAAFLSTVSASINSEIIFETDFANDGDFYASQQQSSWTEVVENVPEGFDGALIEGKGKVYGIPGAGIDGSVAMKFEWDPALGQPVSQLYKHLTGNESTGYDEVYIRYNVRLPNDIKIGRPGIDDIPYWKFGRLWQNTGTAPGDKWTENRSDSGYAVWNFGGTATWGIDAGATFSANHGSNLSKGSAGGERYSNDYYIGRGDFSKHSGHWDAVGDGAWAFDTTSRNLINNSNQTWHTLEWRFKLATDASANDGVFQMWFDGIEQIAVDIRPGGSAPALSDLTPTEQPTTVKGSGYNFLVIFDNMAYWNKHWGDTGVGNGIFVNDVVVSTERIGHSYRVDGHLTTQVSPPSAPLNFRVDTQTN